MAAPCFLGRTRKALGLAGICSALSQFLQKKSRFWGAGGPWEGAHIPQPGHRAPPAGPGGTLRMATQSVSKQPVSRCSWNMQPLQPRLRAPDLWGAASVSES